MSLFSKYFSLRAYDVMVFYSFVDLSWCASKSNNLGHSLSMFYSKKSCINLNIGRNIVYNLYAYYIPGIYQKKSTPNSMCIFDLNSELAVEYRCSLDIKCLGTSKLKKTEI